MTQTGFEPRSPDTQPRLSVFTEHSAPFGGNNYTDPPLLSSERFLTVYVDNIRVILSWKLEDAL